MTFLASGDFCHLLRTFCKQSGSRAGLTKCWFWSWSKPFDTLDSVPERIFFKKSKFWKKSADDNECMKNYPAWKRLSMLNIIDYHIHSTLTLFSKTRDWKMLMMCCDQCQPEGINSSWWLDKSDIHSYECPSQLNEVAQKILVLRAGDNFLSKYVSTHHNSYTACSENSNATSLDKQNKNFQHKIVNISIPINLSICFGCSKEPSHWDGSSEYPQYMFWLRNKKIMFLLHTLN